jgi:hypothetical protein
MVKKSVDFGGVQFPTALVVWTRIRLPDVVA